MYLCCLLLCNGIECDEGTKHMQMYYDDIVYLQTDTNLSATSLGVQYGGIPSRHQARADGGGETFLLEFSSVFPVLRN